MKVLLPYNGGIKKPNPFKTLHSIVNTRVLKNKKKLLHQITQSIYFWQPIQLLPHDIQYSVLPLCVVR